MYTILIVEDDKMFRTMLRECLEHNDIIAFEAMNAHRATEILERQDVDMVLLDINLPDCNGITLLKNIRKETDIPVIIISGDEECSTKVDGLNHGADDYINKPCDPNELIARINANMRRYNAEESNNKQQATEDNTQEIRIGKWRLNRPKYQLFDKKEKSAELTIREYNLLNKLIDNADRAITREELGEAIKEKTYIPTPRAIDIKITRIRKKIDDKASTPQIIKTIRGVGYMIPKEAIKK